MKKIIGFILVAISLIALSSCDDATSSAVNSILNDTSTEAESSIETSEESSIETSEESSNEPSEDSSSEAEPETFNPITNGDFETGTVDPFVVSNFEGAVSDISVITETDGNKMIDVNVQAVSFNQAAPRLEFNTFTLDNSKTYELTFDAYSENEKTIHAQIGEVVVPAAAPWFMTATENDSFFNITKEKKSFSWTILPKTDSDASFSKLSLLIEFGKMSNGASSPSGHTYLDNICINEISEVKADTVKPVVFLNNPPEYFYVGDELDLLKYAKCYDNIDLDLQVVINEESSTMPPVDENGMYTTVGDYLVRFETFDLNGNKGFYDYVFQIRPKPVEIDGFEYGSVAFGIEADLSDPSMTLVYSENDKATIGYDDRAITITTTQSADEPWYATQLFMMTSEVEKSGKHYISFDIESDVAGTITFDGDAYDLEVGTNHFVCYKYMSTKSYKISFQLGVNSSLRQDEKNIGACTVTFSNFKVEYSKDLADVVLPTIEMEQVDQLFVGDELNVFDLIKVYDNVDRRNTMVEVLEEGTTLPALSEDGKLVSAGTFDINYKVSDAAGNYITYVYKLLVKPALVNHNGFSVTSVQFGEEGSLSDVSTANLWNDQGWVGSYTNVTYSVTDYNISLTSDQKATSEYAWFATQLFLKSLPVETAGKYDLTFDIVSNVAGAIQINGSTFDLVVGTNSFNFSEGLLAEASVNLAIQFGTEASGALGAYSIQINDLSLLLGVDQKEFTGFNMSVVKDGTDSIITYTDTPTEWYSNNAQAYLFGLTESSEAAVIEFTGVAGQKYLFKYESTIDNFSKSSEVIATGEKQSVIINVKSLTDLNRDLFYRLVFMVEDEGASGQITIHDYYIIDSISDYYGTEWIGYGMTIDEAADLTTTVSYMNISDNWWNSSANYDVDSFDANNLYITFTFKGTKDTIYLFKVESTTSTETEIVATGEEQTITLDVSSWTEAQRSAINNLVVFVKDPGATGTIVLYKVEYSQVN